MSLMYYKGKLVKTYGFAGIGNSIVVIYWDSAFGSLLMAELSYFTPKDEYEELTDNEKELRNKGVSASTKPYYLN